MITIKCKSKVQEQLLMNELKYNKNLEVSIVTETVEAIEAIELNETVKTIQTPFNGIEKELPNLKRAKIEVMGLSSAGGSNTEATLKGEESALRKYLAKAWDMDEDADEINELFES